MEPTLSSILESSLKWVFVGGKGGVGKTTTSCALATLLATTPVSIDEGSGEEEQNRRPRRVLLVSTDPAHNISDAFDQKIGSEPTPIAGLEENLFAMEIDPSRFVHGSFMASTTRADGNGDAPTNTADNTTTTPFSTFALLGSILKDAAATLPGIDELSVFVEILKGVQELAYDIVIFDTAPTGHTLRMLSLPQTLSSTMEKIANVDGISTLFSAATAFLSTASTDGSLSQNFTPENLQTTLQTWMSLVSEVQAQFTDQSKTAFVCVCIPEFLSVYETERLVQELMKCNIGCEHLVVNQLVLKPASEPPCRMCRARQKVQGKYLEQIDELYEDFHVVKMPLLSDEVRGVRALSQFAHFLQVPYDVEIHGYVDVEGSC